MPPWCSPSVIIRCSAIAIAAMPSATACGGAGRLHQRQQQERGRNEVGDDGEQGGQLGMLQVSHGASQP